MDYLLAFPALVLIIHLPTVLLFKLIESNLEFAALCPRLLFLSASQVFYQNYGLVLLPQSLVVLKQINFILVNGLIGDLSFLHLFFKKINLSFLVLRDLFHLFIKAGNLSLLRLESPLQDIYSF